ncbi:MAG TPA: hypothetical protein VN788_00120 [Verrucomicrobiae bacterium]|nr:hypothetical protein [Verrucomicrobiae bacterium]
MRTFCRRLQTASDAERDARRWLAGLLLFYALCLAARLVQAQENSRRYHLYDIVQLAAENPANWKHPLTHAEIAGWVDYEKKEGDGDEHIRVCDAKGIAKMDAKHCVVVECIPELPCKIPAKGAHVRVRGIARYDAENPGHHWWEIHPVEQLAALP